MVILAYTAYHKINQQLVNICAGHAAENDLLFSTDPDPLKSKTVCMAFSCDNKPFNKEQLGKIWLNKDPLPWKVSAKHIGCTLNEDGTMDQDIRTKRAIFIDNCMNLNNEFSFMRPENQVTLLRLYNAHFTGSAAWSFTSVLFQQLVNSWNVNLKVIFDLPYASNNFLVEEISGGKNAKQMIYKRYIKFLSSVAKNRRESLVALLNSAVTTVRSLTGGNLRKVLLDSDVRITPGVTKGQVLSDYRVYETPAGQEWRAPLVLSPIEVRNQNWVVQFEEETGILQEDEATLIINDVCVS